MTEVSCHVVLRCVADGDLRSRTIYRNKYSFRVAAMGRNLRENQLRVMGYSTFPCVGLGLALELDVS